MGPQNLGDIYQQLQNLKEFLTIYHPILLQHMPHLPALLWLLLKLGPPIS